MKSNIIRAVALSCFTLLFLSCKPKTNIVKTDFEFLIGDWYLDNSSKGNTTIMTWTQDADGFSATLKSESTKNPEDSFNTQYTIKKTWGQWYFQDYPSKKRTKAPSLAYKLHKLEDADYTRKKAHATDITFRGESQEKLLDKSHYSTFSLYLIGEKLHFNFSKYPNIAVFKRVKN